MLDDEPDMAKLEPNRGHDKKIHRGDRVAILREPPNDYQTDHESPAGISSTVDQRIERLEKASDFGSVRY